MGSYLGMAPPLLFGFVTVMTVEVVASPYMDNNWNMMYSLLSFSFMTLGFCYVFSIMNRQCFLSSAKERRAPVYVIPGVC